MPELSEAAQQLLARQKARYVATLPDKAQELSELANDLHALLDVAHKIAGSAGLHRLDHVQAEAAALEQSIKSGQESALVQQQLQQLLSAIETASGAPDC